MTLKNDKKTFDFTYALKNGVLVHVDEVVNGKDCDCFCPCCNLPLIAYNNPKNKNAHHFQHASKKSCNYYYETIIHYLAKELIHELGELTVPKHSFLLSDRAIDYSYAGSSLGIKFPIENIKLEKLRFDKVEVEKYENGIKPDLIAYIGSKKLHIEIAVTHFVDDLKVEKIKNLGSVTLEIDLSKFERNIQKDKLKEVLLGDNNHMKWINNQKVEKDHMCSMQTKSIILDFIRGIQLDKKVYGKNKTVYKCPLKSKDVNVSNCKSCRYFAYENETMECTDWENRKFIYHTSIGCIGHKSKQFDELLLKNGIEIPK